MCLYLPHRSRFLYHHRSRPVRHKRHITFIICIYNIMTSGVAHYVVWVVSGLRFPSKRDIIPNAFRYMRDYNFKRTCRMCQRDMRIGRMLYEYKSRIMKYNKCAVQRQREGVKGGGMILIATGLNVEAQMNPTKCEILVFRQSFLWSFLLKLLSSP